MPSKGKILRHWYERADQQSPTRPSIDIGEPTCWACGEGWEGRYDVGRSDASWRECVEAWDKALLQCCHIVPQSLDGGDDPSNIYLMCAECHDLAPDTAVPEIFFEWVGKQSHWKRKKASLLQSLDDFGIDVEDESLCNKSTRTAQSPAFQEWMKDETSIHRKQRPPHGPRLSHASFVGLLVQYWRESGADSTSEELREVLEGGEEGAGVVLYHVVKRDEGFEEAAQTLFELVRGSQGKYPDRYRSLYLDIEGHRNEQGGFDADMFELQRDYLIGFLARFLMKVESPLTKFSNTKGQENDIPDRLEVRKDDTKGLEAGS